MDVAQYLSSADEVDVTERAYAFLTDLISENSANFHSDARICWGCFEDEFCFINRTVMDRLLTDAGYDMGSVMNKWEQKGYIVRYQRNRIRHMKRINGAVTSCIKLRLPDTEDRQTDMEDY